MAPPPPPSPPATGAQYAHQFLNTALSQRGPSALPYAEDVKWLIRNHLVALADAFPSLHPKAALFTHNDGRAAHLLQADGTIPILHAGVSYNLPAVIWLPEPYPRSPPLLFLSPTRDMLIKPHHPLVDRSGLVANAPYLRSWVFPSSNLVDLVRSVSHLFGLDPPLFTRSPTTNPPPIVAPSPPPRLLSSLSRPLGGSASPRLQLHRINPVADAQPSRGRGERVLARMLGVVRRAAAGAGGATGVPVADDVGQGGQGVREGLRGPVGLLAGGEEKGEGEEAEGLVLIRMLVVY